MSLGPPNITELLYTEKLKEFLKTVMGKGLVAVSLCDTHGHTIMEEFSPSLSDEHIREMSSKSEFQDLKTRLLMNHSPDTIQKTATLPIYGVPLSCQATKLGALMIWFSDQWESGNHHYIFSIIWLHLQDLLSAGYELSNLSSEIVRNYEELTLLYNISSRLGTESDVHRILEITVECVQSILPASSVAVMLVDKEKGEVVSRFAVDGKGDPLPVLRLKQGTGITGQAIAAGQPKIVCNVREHPAFVAPPYSVKSLLSVPIAIGNHVIGTVNVSNKAHGAEFTTYDSKLVSAIASQTAVALENARLFTEGKELYLSAVKSLVMAIDAKDASTHSHSLRVSELSTAIAEVMGFDSRMIEEISLAALLHDVGKIGVPEHVLLKSGVLNHEEWEEMKQHPLYSVQILNQVKAFEHLSIWVRHEHERYDGKGYPDGIKGEDIPLPSRIIAVADAFDAITSDRHYRSHQSSETAIKILKEHAGTQFDPRIVDAALIAFSRKEPGKTDLTE